MVVERKKRSGGVSYYARFKGPDGWTEEKSPGRTKREAQQLEAQRKREVASGTYRKGSMSTDALTLEAYSKQWLSSRNNKTKSYDEQRLRDYVVPALGKKRLRELRAVDCIAFVRGLVDRGINPKTISNIWGALRTLLRDAYIAELIAFSPVMPRGVIPDRQHEIRDVYQNVDVLALCEATPFDELEEQLMRRFALIAFYTGMRQGEICGLRWGDYEPSDGKMLGSLLVRRQYSGEGHDASTKTGRARRVPVHPILAAHLDRALPGSVKSHPIVFLRLGEHHTKSTSYKAFVRHCSNRGVTSLGVHRTRHTAITAMRRGGVPAAEVERVTHNSRGTIVDRYTHDLTILCAAVSAIDYGSRGESRGALANTTANALLGPGSIPGASTGQNRKTRDNQGQIADSDVQVFSGFPVLATRRGALRENLHPELDALRAIVSSWDRWRAVPPGTPASDLGLKLLRDAVESAREVAR